MKAIGFLLTIIAVGVLKSVASPYAGASLPERPEWCAGCRSVHIDEDVLPDLARITGSSVEIFLNRNGWFSPRPSMIISIEDFEKAAAKGSMIGSRWPYLVKKYGLPSRPPLARNRADHQVIPRILSGPTFLEDISDTIDFELKWRNENIPELRIVGFAADDLDGDDVPEIAIMYWVEGDENGERLQIYKNYGEGNWQLAFDSTAMGLKSYGMVAHDFDSDNHAEVIWIHRDDSKVQVFNTMSDYWIGNCNLYGYLNQDSHAPPFLFYPEGESLPRVQSLYEYYRPEICDDCWETWIDLKTFYRRQGNRWLFSSPQAIVKSFSPVVISDVKMGDVDNDGVNEVVPAFSLQYHIWPGDVLPIFYFDNFRGNPPVYDSLYLYHGLTVIPHNAVSIQDFDSDGANELFFCGGGNEHSRENMVWAPGYVIIDGISGDNYDTIFADFRRFEEYPMIIGRSDYYSQNILTILSSIPAIAARDSSLNILNLEFLKWEENQFKPIFKGGWIPNWSFNFFNTLDKLYINDIDNDGLEDVLIFEPGLPDDYILHWERKPFSLGLKEFSTSPGSSYVDITVRLEEPRTDVGLTVYRHLANNIVAECYYTLESLNAQPLIGDTVFILRDYVKIKGMPYHYFLVADDYDGCPSVYGPIYGNSFGNLQEPVLMFEVFNDAAPETLAVYWSLLYYDSQWELYRSTDADGVYEKVADTVFAGDPAYLYLDGDVYPGVSYFYKLRLVWPENAEPWYGPCHNAAAGGDYPERPVISPAYPNPFGDRMRISIEMPLLYKEGHFNNISLTIYNLLGRKVAVKSIDNAPPGRTEIYWDGTDDNGRRAANGVYFYRLRIGGHDIKKGKLLKVK